MTMHYIVISMNMAWGDARIVARCIAFGVKRPSDERPPVMCRQLCLVPRVSVHDRYYCTLV